MTAIQLTGPADVSALASMEDQLAQTLVQTAGEVAHIECLDTEQRAEIYAILQTLQSDNQAHRTLLALLSGQAGRPCHA